MSKKTTELLGQSLVLAKLCRLGYVCSTTPTNAEGVDIVAYRPSGNFPTKLVQVKTMTDKDGWQFYGTDLLEIQMAVDDQGNYKQEITGLKPLRNIVYAFVRRTERKCDKCGNTMDKMFYCMEGDIQQIVHRKYSEILAQVNPKKGKIAGYRTNRGKSTHLLIKEQDLTLFEDEELLII